MELPTKKSPPLQKNPAMTVLFGPSKVGKTTKLVELDDCLIIDTEKGTKYLEAMRVPVNNLKDFSDVVKALRASEHRYKYIALDVIDSIADWYESLVCQQNKVANIGDIPYGAGYGMVREKVMNAVKALKPLTDHLIIIGHRKKTIIGNETIEFNASSLDLSGKMKNVLMADADAIGMVYRDDESNLMISFQGSEEVEVGSRVEHLKGQIIPFEWDKIYIE